MRPTAAAYSRREILNRPACCFAITLTSSSCCSAPRLSFPALPAPRSSELQESKSDEVVLDLSAIKASVIDLAATSDFDRLFPRIAELLDMTTVEMKRVENQRRKNLNLY